MYVGDGTVLESTHLETAKQLARAAATENCILTGMVMMSAQSYEDSRSEPGREVRDFEALKSLIWLSLIVRQV